MIYWIVLLGVVTKNVKVVELLLRECKSSAQHNSLSDLPMQLTIVQHFTASYSDSTR